MSRDYRDENYDRPRRTRGNRAKTDGATMLGVVSLVFGIKALIASLIPCVGVVAIGLATVSLTLGIVGIVIARKSPGSSIGLPVAGTIVSGLAVAFSVMWLLVMGAFFKGVKDTGQEIAENQRQQRQAEQKAVRAGSAVAVSATELWDAYDTNSVNADRDYKGKVLEVTGKVVRVTNRGFGVTVELEADENNREVAIDCEFSNDAKASLGGIKPKQTVTIRGRCKGKLGRRVTLDECVLAN